MKEKTPSRGSLSVENIRVLKGEKMLLKIELRLYFACRPAYTRFSHYRVAPGDRIRRPKQPN